MICKKELIAIKSSKKISEAELEVLKVIWSKNEPISSNEISQKLKEIMNWEKSTTRTLIYRLVDKGALKQEKKEIYYYTSAISEKEYLQEETKQFINRFYKGNAKNLVASLFEQEYIDSSDINELKQIWSESEDNDD